MKKRIFGIWLAVAMLCCMLSNVVMAADVEAEAEAAAAPAKSGWVEEKGSWYYLSNSGSRITGWLQEGQKWYYLRSSGKMATGWESVDGVWYYFWPGGSMATGWQYLDGAWYYLWSTGPMARNWVCIDDRWYYLGSDGAMRTGPQTIDGQQYYFYDSGTMVTNWEYLPLNWRHADRAGYAASREYGWFYFGTGGVMQTGWILDGSTWYYCQRDGLMATGWIHDGKQWYYLNDSGAWSDYTPASPVATAEEDYRDKCARIFGTVVDDPRDYYDCEASDYEKATDHLVTISVQVWDFADSSHTTKITKNISLQVHENIAETVKAIFAEIYAGDEKFPINYAGGYYTSTQSEHNPGLAIDINADSNYYCKPDGTAVVGSHWDPENDPYSIPEGGDVDQAFANHGFRRGIYWNSGYRDYMHYSFFGT